MVVGFAKVCDSLRGFAKVSGSKGIILWCQCGAEWDGPYDSPVPIGPSKNDEWRLQNMCPVPQSAASEQLVNNRALINVLIGQLVPLPWPDSPHGGAC